LKFYLDQYDQTQEASRRMTAEPLKEDHSARAKEMRIEALEPLFRSNKFFCHQSHSEFLNEYYTYPSCRTRDVLDCLGYATNTFDAYRFRDIVSAVRNLNDRRRNREVSNVTGY
jgi:hypothetical protein